MNNNIYILFKKIDDDQSSDNNRQVPDKIHLFGSLSSFSIFRLAVNT